MSTSNGQPDRPPHNPEAERGTLGGMLRDNGVIPDVLLLVQAEDFYADAHQKVFRAIARLHDKGKPVDPVTLGEQLHADKATAANITTEAFERLLMKSPNDGWRLLIALCWECGLRRAEARNVRGEDVDLKRRRIAIPDNKAGDKDATVILTPELRDLLLERWPDGKLPEGRLITAVEMASDLPVITKLFKRIARKNEPGMREVKETPCFPAERAGFSDS